MSPLGTVNVRQMILYCILL